MFRLVTFIFVCALNYGVIAENTTSKSIDFRVTCDNIAWDGHEWMSCFMAITITNEDLNSFVFNNKTFANNAAKFIKQNELNGTCYLANNLGTTGLVTLEYSSSSRNLIRTEYNTTFTSYSIESSRCDVVHLSLLNSTTYKMTNSCNVTPKRKSSLCNITKYELLINMHVTLDIINATAFNTIAIVKSVSNRTKSHIGSCDIDPEYAVIIVDQTTCPNILRSSIPDKCLSREWNEYVWETCSASVWHMDIYDETKVLGHHLDGALMKNVTQFCNIYQWPAMKNCTNAAGFCKVPSNDEYIKYNDLTNFYDIVCLKQSEFLKYQSCLEGLKSVNVTYITYNVEVAKCYQEANKSDNKICETLRRNILCKALSLYKHNRNCSTFGDIYKFENLVTGNTDMKSHQCSSDTIDPCSTDLTVSKFVCSGASHMSWLSLIVNLLIGVFLPLITLLI